MGKIKILVVPSDNIGGVGFYRSTQPHVYLAEKYPEELKRASIMSREYIEEMDRKTFDMMNEDDIKLTLYVSRKRGCGSRLLNDLCGQFKQKGYKKLYLWTDCECDWEWYTEHGYELVEQGVYKPFSSENEDYRTFVFRKEL